jgi:hypothetical protein
MGTARSKVRLQASPTLLRRLIELRGERDPAFASLEPLSALATMEQELAMATMAPRLTTWYRRAAMSAESGRLRITLDERLTFCRPQHVGVVGAEVTPSSADVVAAGPARILEIKHWGDRPVWLAWALQGLEPARGFSKFATGMAALNEKRGGARAEVDTDGDADTSAAVATYFAPTQGTA